MQNKLCCTCPARTASSATQFHTTGSWKNSAGVGWAWSPAFSPDGNYIFFRKAVDSSEIAFSVFRVPGLGGTPQLLVGDVDSGPAISLDGKRMAYLRGNDPEPGKYRLLSANLDGSDEKILQIAPAPIPANDMRGYRWLSLSADGKSVVSIQWQQSDSVSSQPATGKGSPTAVSGIPNQSEVRGVGWDAHGNLLITTTTAILRMSSDGTRQTTLLNDPAERILYSSICPRGGPILISTYLREGKTSVNIWRIEADGSRPRQLTTGKDEEFPLCSADGKSFYYYHQATARIMKMPIGGGSPELVKASAVPNEFTLGALNFSPDGKWMPEVLTSTDPGTQATIHQIALIDVSGNLDALAKHLDVRADVWQFIGFLPDGKALAYAVVENGVGNIWAEPLDGSKGHMLTNFTSDQIRAFQFSPDGKTLTVARRHVVSDVVLLHETSGASH